MRLGQALCRAPQVRSGGAGRRSKRRPSTFAVNLPNFCMRSNMSMHAQVAPCEGL